MLRPRVRPELYALKIATDQKLSLKTVEEQICALEESIGQAFRVKDEEAGPPGSLDPGRGVCHQVTQDNINVGLCSLVASCILHPPAFASPLGRE